MARKIWTLTDVAADEYIDQFSLGTENIEGVRDDFSITKRTLRGGLRDGVDMIEVDNGRLWLAVVPTRGMGVWGAICGDVHLGWASPVDGPVNPKFVPIWEPSGIGWLSGFDELLVRCGLESNGAPEFRPDGTLLYPLHGKIANTPAHSVTVSFDEETGEIGVQGIVDETRLFGNKLRLVSTVTTKLGCPWFKVADEVTNISAEPGEMELLYHINFGLPLLAPGASFHLPVKKVAPRDAVAAADAGHWNIYDPETPGKPEACFFIETAAGDSGETQALLRSPDGGQGVGVKFNKQQMPCFTLWKNRQAAADGYVTGLEPGINYPNPRSFEKEKGRVAALAPGESRTFEITIEAYETQDSVDEALKAAEAIQEHATPEILAAPDPEWSDNR